VGCERQKVSRPSGRGGQVVLVLCGGVQRRRPTGGGPWREEERSRGTAESASARREGDAAAAAAAPPHLALRGRGRGQSRRRNGRVETRGPLTRDVPAAAMESRAADGRRGSSLLSP